jgi:hypothetical protein
MHMHCRTFGEGLERVACAKDECELYTSAWSMGVTMGVFGESVNADSL